MTDSWSRPPDGDRRPPVPTDDVIEITLAGPDGFEAPARPDDLALDDDQPDGTPPGEPNWRRVVGISSIVGVVLGVIVAIVVLGGDDEADETDAATTTLAPDEASTRITTPPTLPPVDEVDDAFAGQEQPDGRSGGGEGVPSVPEYPPVLAETWGVAAADFPLRLPALPVDRPVISLISISRFGESFGGPAAYDPVTDRFRIELGDDTGSQVLLIDLRTGEILLSFDGDDDDLPARWNRVDDEIFGPNDEIELRDYVAALLLGPLRADNIAAATSIDGDQLVLLDESTAARRRDVVIPADAIAEWDTLYGSGVDDRAANDLEFELYISQDGATYITQGVNDTAGELIATVHRVRIGDDRISIDWPSDDLIDDVPPFDDTPEPADLTIEELTPVYEPAEGADDLVFDLAGAVEQLRATTPPVYTVSDRGPRGVSEITVRRDDANDRLAFTRRVVEVRDETVPFGDYYAQIDDRPTNTGWLRRNEDDPWVSVALGGGLDPIDPRWSVGLVTGDELAAVERVGTGSPPVVLDDGIVARPFLLAMPPDTLRWTEPLVGGVSTSSDLAAVVYVGTDGLIHEIHLTANQGLPRLYVQRFDHRQRAVTVELP